MGKASQRKKEAAKARAAAPAATPAATAERDPAALHRATIPLAAALLLAFLILKCFALHPQRSDEGIYFYEAWRLAHGARLYRDLFFAHPPLHLLLPSLLIGCFGYSLPLCKALAPLAAATQGALAFVIARRIFRSDVAALVALAALLFAEDFLKSSSYFTGINLADALLYGGVALLVYRRPAIAGVLVGAATMTLLQTAPMAFVVALATLLFDRPTGLRFLAGMAATLVVVHAIGFAYGGGAFVEQVYLYHLHKVAAEGAGAKMVGFLVADNLFLFCGGMLALALALSPLDERAGPRRFLRALAAGVLLQSLAMATRPKVFPFYFQPIFLPFALALGWAISVAVTQFRAAASWPARARAAGVIALVALLPTLLTSPITAFVSPLRDSQHQHYFQSYQWKDAPLPGPLNGLVKSLLWSNGERIAGSWHFAPTEYLWNQSRGFDAYPAIAAAVERNCPADCTLFGDSTTLPLIALGTHRAITADFVDTNAQRFLSGATSPSLAIDQLEKSGGPTLILNSNDAGVFSIPLFQSYLKAHYRLIERFADSSGTSYSLLLRSN